jgi:putative membrane protein insertion efficiency factor
VGSVFQRLQSLPRQLLLLLVRGYRLLLKPWLGNACRFEPTCSEYALQALRRHGALRGSALAGTRLLRCHPWCEGGCDAVPSRWPDSARGLFVRRPHAEGAAPAERHTLKQNLP